MMKRHLSSCQIDFGKVVNVAKVKQLSPFRYPGGKTWLVPYIKMWLKNLSFRPSLFIEPFVGGGIISLTVASENLADEVLMIELDEQISDVWETIIKGDGERFANEIDSFEFSEENVNRFLSLASTSKEEKALQTIIKNRINHGGIIAPGAGRLKNGENGKGIASRWYPKTLKKRILSILAIRHRIKFLRDDGIEIINRYASHKNAVFFIDPPYIAGDKKAGRRLYTYSDVNHNKLFDETSNISGDFLMTYENSEEIRNLSAGFGFNICEVAMQNTHLTKMKELLIGKNLNWARKDKFATQLTIQ
jgi:DNA adenine methylase